MIREGKLNKQNKTVVMVLVVVVVVVVVEKDVRVHH